MRGGFLKATSLCVILIFTLCSQTLAQEQRPQNEQGQQAPVNTDTNPAQQVPASDGANPVQQVPANDGANPAQQVPTNDDANPAQQVPANDGANPAQQVPTNDGANPAQQVPANDGANPAQQVPTNADTSIENYNRRGIVIAKNRLKINSQVGATISKLHVAEGVQFNKNDLLIEFDCSIERAALEEARLSHEIAKFDYNKKQREAEEMPVSPSTLELLKLENELALTKLNHIRERTKGCRLLAPFTGRVLKILVSEYETAAKLEPVMEVIDDQPFYFRVFLPWRWLKNLSIGDTAKINIMGEDYPAELANLAQEVDPLDQSVKALLKFKSQDKLKLGMNGTAEFNLP